ncbi:MAG: hypothetical protein M0R17_05005 [Candidatus Omnitrophica bacterium]|jgi:hypothetical protein|nr:hypothetical protein [Candidatus Omnitrophota bacterium]
MKFSITEQTFKYFNKLFNYDGPIIYDNHTYNFEVSDDFIRDYKIELSSGNRDNYTTMLIRLLHKAHGYNWDKLMQIYPNECLFIWCWKNIPDFTNQL